MKHHHKILGCSLLALSAVLATAPALASDDCEAPVTHWQSREAVRQMAAQKGWEVQRLKIDDGCYEIRGTNAEGRDFKAKIDPETLEVIKLKQRDHKADRKGDRKREGDRRHAPRAGGDTAPPDMSPGNPLFTPGTTPRSQIE